MSLTLANFESEIDAVILKRGKECFENHQVMDLRESATGVWNARVVGAELYDVEVLQYADGELRSTCTCPYEWGPVCKHVTAVLYALAAGSANREDSVPVLEEQPKGRTTRHQTLQEALAHVSREELLDVILGLAQADRHLTNLLLLRFEAVGQGKAAYVEMVKQALDSGQHRRGFIDYQGAIEAGKRIWKILAEGYKAVGKEPDRAMDIFQAVLETVIPALGYADDSSGDLSGCISYALSGLKAVYPSLPVRDRAALFDYCLQKAPSDQLSGWDWEWELIRLAADMVVTPDERQRVFSALDQMAEKLPHGYAGSNLGYYRRKSADEIKLAVIERLDGSAAAEQFMLDRAESPDFRRRLVEYYLGAGCLDEAKKVSREWVLKRPVDRLSNHTYFNHVLLKIAIQEGEQEEIIRLATVLFLTTGEFSYFDLLKQRIAPETWPSFRSTVIEQSQRPQCLPTLLAEIYVREEMWPQLLAWVQSTGCHSLDRYLELLEPHFPVEVGREYEKQIAGLAANQVNHSAYVQIREYLQRMQGMGQEGRVREIVKELREKYRRRRTLMRELQTVVPE